MCVKCVSSVCQVSVKCVSSVGQVCQMGIKSVSSVTSLSSVCQGCLVCPVYVKCMSCM